MFFHTKHMTSSEFSPFSIKKYSKLLVSFLLTVWFLCPMTYIHAQSLQLRGRIVDAKTQEALPFASVLILGTRKGVVSDIEGYFTLTDVKAPLKLQVQYVGYNNQELEVNDLSKILIIEMKASSQLLGEVQVFPGENPAHEIIRKVYQNKNKNDPEQLPYFVFKSYTKFILDLEEDTPSKNKTPVQDKTDSDLKVDSMNQKVRERMEKQYFFLTETVSERKYKRPGKINENVLATRVSGFKDPMFALLGTQLQGFSFYRDHFRILGETYASPISKNPFNDYFFIIEDTLYNHLEQDTVILISFRNKPKKEFKTMKGMLYIALPDYAITNVIAGPAAENPALSISIQQQYEKSLGKWFPTQLNSDFSFDEVKLGGFHPVGKMRSYLSEIALDTVLRNKEFRGVDVKISPKAAHRDSSYWDEFRTHTLSEKEMNTYQIIDSIGEANKFESKLKIFQALSEGNIVYKYFEIPMDKVLAFNLYEGLRLGFGLNTSRRFSERFKAGGYFAYGFNDETWKYAYQASLTLNEDLQLRIGGSYRFDLSEAGMPSFVYERNTSFNPSGVRRFYIKGWDQSSKADFYVEIHPTPRWKNRLAFQRDNRFFVGNYSFINLENNQIGNGFTFAQIEYQTQYAPKDKYVQTALGRRPISYTFPRYDLAYAIGFQGIAGGEFQYQKVDAKYTGRLGTGRFGFFYYQMQAGTVQGQVPTSLLYAGQANVYNGPLDRYRGHFNLADRHAFETMGMNEYLLSSYGQVFLRYDFENSLFHRKPFRPHIELVARALWGSNPDIELHQGLGTTTPSEGFYETGIEVNKIPTGRINLLNSTGLGFYYRINPVSEQEIFAQRYRIKITSKF